MGANLRFILENTPVTSEQQGNYATFVEGCLQGEETLLKTHHEEGLAVIKTHRLTAVHLYKNDLGSLLTFTEYKTKALQNLTLLERDGLASRKKNFNEILQSVAADIRNQTLLRKERKSELATLNSTLAELAKKKAYYTLQVESYDSYLDSVMGSMSKDKQVKKKTGFWGRKTGNDGSGVGTTVSYSAMKLKEKGVVVEIDNCPPHQMKFVTVEITSTEVGLYRIIATIMGGTIKMEPHLIRLQELLQLQYENVQTMKLMDAVTVNVNLLIFLINKKFLNTKKWGVTFLSS